MTRVQKCALPILRSWAFFRGKHPFLKYSGLKDLGVCSALKDLGGFSGENIFSLSTVPLRIWAFFRGKHLFLKYSALKDLGVCCALKELRGFSGAFIFS